MPSAAAHVDPVAGVVLALTIILLAAKLGGDLASRVGQPAVLGELLAGVLIGNLNHLGFAGLEYLESDASIQMLAALGVLLLLFEVGLESSVGEMMRVGVAAFVVAVAGVVVPFALGWMLSAWLLPEATPYLHAFLGATLSATSVGITARVLQDLGRSKTDEARLILGAAVVDDVFGLVILAVVGGAIAAADMGGAFSYSLIGSVVAKATLFLAGSLVLGVYLSPKLFNLASKLKARGVLLALGLAFCFFLSWLSGLVGLAPIVGAFAAGLILEDLHFRDFLGRGERSLDELIQPIASFLVPIFFVLMGMRIDLASFARPGILGLSAILTLAAVAGKLVCSLAVIRPGMDRLSIGIGMVPRGEVGLIFANLGLSLKLAGKPLLDAGLYSAIVVMIILTTLMTPPALKWSLGRRKS